MFVEVKDNKNKIFIVPKTFYEDVLKNDGFILVYNEPKKEVENVRYNTRIERQDNRESNKTTSK